MKINVQGKYVLVVCPNPSVDILATLDQLEPGIPNRIISEQRYPGGKGIHVAMALSELGINVVLAGIWGGATGQWIKDQCLKYYPSLRLIGPEIAEWSRSCYTFKGFGDHHDTELLGAGPSLSEDTVLDLNEQVEKHLSQAKALVLSGSWPKGAPATGYRELISLGQKYEVAAFLDCTGTQLEHALEAQPFCVHLNRKEVTDYFEKDFEVGQRELLRHCEVAAITDGSKGLYLISRSVQSHSLKSVDKVISTVGCGDCLLGGIVAGYIQNMTFSEIAELGAACGAANCLRSELGMLRKDDVENLIEH